MEVMTFRYSFALAVFSGLVGSTLAHAQLKQVQTVYLLPMGGGLDQYLANRMVEQHLFQVVTDPQRADAILVDRIGEGLEDKLAEMYPDEKKKPEKEAEKDKKNDFSGTGVKVGNTNLKSGKGTLFLIDRRNHTVLWSIYSPSRSSQAKDVNRNAESIAKKLALAIGEVKK
jgi:hypothetical protein